MEEKTMSHTAFNPKMYALPTTQLILGTRVDDKVNFMALAWATRVNAKPPLISIAVHQNHMSHRGILQNKEFSLCMPNRALLAKTDYVGLVSARKVDKSALFEVFYGELEHAPLIRECPLNLELQLHDAVDLPTNTLFIGEITGTWCEEKCLTDGVPDIVKIDPFILTMPDNRYWSIGDQAGNAWKDGKSMKS